VCNRSTPLLLELSCLIKDLSVPRCEYAKKDSCLWQSVPISNRSHRVEVWGNVAAFHVDNSVKRRCLLGTILRVLSHVAQRQPKWNVPFCESHLLCGHLSFGQSHLQHTAW
jgi:hypothetical protein